MTNHSFSIEIPTDSDGYFSLCCPYCNNEFKILNTEFENQAAVNIYCPVCGLIAEFNSFYTEKVIDKAHSIAINHVENMLHQMFKDLERKNRGNKFMKIKAGRKPSTSEPELYEHDDHLVVANKLCCNSHVKITELDKWLIPYCIYCGGK